jgi:hypothetical protein
MGTKSIAIAAILALLAALAPVQAGNITRGFSSGSLSPGNQLTVTLSVDVNSSETYFALDEGYPPAWNLVDSGGLDTNHSYHLKNVTIQDARDTQFVYVLTAPSQAGTYAWSGIYMLEGMEDERDILGPAQVTVLSPAPDDDGDGNGGDGTHTPQPGCTEGDERPCSDFYSGICGEGTATCRSNQWSGCPRPADEACNGLDDDCDGEVDNGAGCCTDGEERQCGPATDEGECRLGKSVCASGTWVPCMGAVYPAEEICGDGLDNDCDGESDEGCRAPACGWGQISGACICESSVRVSGYCCDGLYYDDGCPFPWPVLIYAGVIILINLYVMMLYFRRKGRKMTTQAVEEELKLLKMKLQVLRLRYARRKARVL